MDITHTHTHTATVQSVASRDVSGDPVYEVKRTFKCRVEYSLWSKDQFVSRELDDYDRISTITQIFTSDRIWLPDTDTSDTEFARTVHRVDRVEDLAGDLVHYVVRL